MALQKDKEVKGLFVRPGVRGDTWVYLRNRAGKIHRASLGPVEETSITEARRWATNLNLAQAGKEPVYTLGDVVKAHTTAARRKGYRKVGAAEDSIARYSPDWLRKELGQITKAMVNERHEKLAAQRGPSSAAMFVRTLKSLYTFAENAMDYVGRNPARGVETAPARARQTIWTDAQFTAFLAACMQYDPTGYWRDFYLVLARTGMRKMNVATMRWDEIAGDVWTIPAAKFKTGVEHRAYLVPEVMEVLARRKNDSQWVFPTCTGGPITNPNYVFLIIRKLAGLESVTIHDLRRTLGSKLAARVPIPIVAKVLGHKSIATTMRSYVVASDGDAKAALMNLAGQHQQLDLRVKPFHPRE